MFDFYNNYPKSHIYNEIWFVDNIKHFYIDNASKSIS